VISTDQDPSLLVIWTIPGPSIGNRTRSLGRLAQFLPAAPSPQGKIRFGQRLRHLGQMATAIHVCIGRTEHLIAARQLAR